MPDFKVLSKVAHSGHIIHTATEKWHFICGARVWKRSPGLWRWITNSSHPAHIFSTIESQTTSHDNHTHTFHSDWSRFAKTSHKTRDPKSSIIHGSENPPRQVIGVIDLRQQADASNGDFAEQQPSKRRLSSGGTMRAARRSAPNNSPDTSHSVCFSRDVIFWRASEVWSKVGGFDGVFRVGIGFCKMKMGL